MEVLGIKDFFRRSVLQQKGSTEKACKFVAARVARRLPAGAGMSVLSSSEHLP
jgi:hypothetical protein